MNLSCIIKIFKKSLDFFLKRWNNTAVYFQKEQVKLEPKRLAPVEAEARDFNMQQTWQMNYTF